MANSYTQASRAPISRHPAFVPLCAVWLAALLSGCIAVLPDGLIASSMAQFAIPTIAKSQAVLAPVAGVAGGLVGWAGAKVIASAQTDRQAELEGYDPHVIEEEAAVALADHEDDRYSIADDLPLVEAEPETEAPSPNELIPDDTSVPADPIVEVMEAKEQTPQHGKAVNLLRTQATDALAMPQLIERFAVALDDHRSAVEDAVHSYSPPTPPAEMGDRLRALLPQTRLTN